MDRVDYQSLVVQDLINLNRRDELNLQPWYQRRSNWTRPQKAYLINTILEGKPVPSVYIRHSLDLQKEKSIREVVDGQQRIRSVLEYAAGEFAARHPKHTHRVKYNQLTSSEREKFKLTSLAVGYLVGADDSDVVEIFGRLNSVSKTLNLQEKRNARFSGEFKQFCLKQASARVTFWRDYHIFSANDIARMLEVQFVSPVSSELDCAGQKLRITDLTPMNSSDLLIKTGVNKCTCHSGRIKLTQPFLNGSAVFNVESHVSPLGFLGCNIGRERTGRN